MSRRSTLTGPQKAAIVVMQLERDKAAELLQAMREAEIAEITAEIARLGPLESSIVDEVLSEFNQMTSARSAITQGGLEAARNLLEASLGTDRAAHVLEMVASSLVEVPFEFLRRADPRQVLSFLQEEHPQTIALVLAHMPPEQAALVLSGLSEELQRDIAYRLAVMDRTSPEVIEHVEAVLQRKLSSVLQPTEMSVAGGVQSLVDILNRSDRGTERHILEGLESANVELADEVRQRMFVFEDIVTLDDRSVQMVLRQVDGKELAVALKGVRADVRDKIMRNMSERAAQNLAEEMELLGPVRIKNVEEAQGAVVRVIRTLEESGQLVLSRSADEFVV